MEHGIIWYRRGTKEKRRQDLNTSTSYLEKKEFRPSYSVPLLGNMFMPRLSWLNIKPQNTSFVSIMFFSVARSPTDTSHCETWCNLMPWPANA